LDRNQMESERKLNENQTGSEWKLSRSQTEIRQGSNKNQTGIERNPALTLLMQLGKHLFPGRK
ncbi:hypothetical protein, partial [Bacteroides fragilis]